MDLLFTLLVATIAYCDTTVEGYPLPALLKREPRLTGKAASSTAGEHNHGQAHAAETELDHLFEELFSTQNHRHVRPCEETNCAGKVKVSLGLQPHYFSLDIGGKVLSTHGVLTVRWNDPRLRWPADDYDNIGKIRVPQSRVWLPSILLLNGLGRVRQDSLWSREVPLLVSSDGTVTLESQTQLTTFCDFTDTGSTETCQLKVGSGSSEDVELVATTEFPAWDTTMYKGTTTTGWLYQTSTATVEGLTLSVSTTFDRGTSRSVELHRATGILNFMTEE